MIAGVSQPRRSTSNMTLYFTLESEMKPYVSIVTSIVSNHQYHGVSVRWSVDICIILYYGRLLRSFSSATQRLFDFKCFNNKSSVIAAPRVNCVQILPRCIYTHARIISWWKRGDYLKTKLRLRRSLLIFHFARAEGGRPMEFRN